MAAPTGTESRLARLEVIRDEYASMKRAIADDSVRVTAQLTAIEVAIGELKTAMNATFQVHDREIEKLRSTIQTMPYKWVGAGAALVAFLSGIAKLLGFVP